MKASTVIRLADYQTAGIDFILKHKRSLICLPTGKGKTKILIGAARKIPGTRLLVICPKTLVGQWRANLAGEEFPWKILRITQVRKGAEALVHFGATLTVIDEPKFLKGTTQARVMALGLRTPRRVILDATPIENRLEEAFYLFTYLKPKLFGTLEEFQAKFGARGRYKNLDKFRETIAPHIFAPKIDDTRPKNYKYIPVEMNFGPNTGEYDNLCRRLYNLLSKARGSRGINAAFGLISKLLSFLGDPECGSKMKLKALLRLVKDNPKMRGVVFVSRKTTAKLIKEKLNESGVPTEVINGELSAGRREVVRSMFNEEKLRFIVATSAGERGVDMPSGNAVIHFDLPWTRASFDQRDRVTRMSSDKSVTTDIVTFIIEGSVEEVIWSIVCGKHELMLEPFYGGARSLKITRRSWKKFLGDYFGEEDESHGYSPEMRGNRKTYQFKQDAEDPGVRGRGSKKAW